MSQGILSMLRFRLKVNQARPRRPALGLAVCSAICAGRQAGGGSLVCISRVSGSAALGLGVLPQDPLGASAVLMTDDPFSQTVGAQLLLGCGDGTPK